jgi:hypothetical protein
MRTCTIAKKNKVGETSSKYGYKNGGEQFISDLKAHEERQNFLWNEFVNFMKSNDVNPSELRSMFTRYYEEFLI